MKVHNRTMSGRMSFVYEAQKRHPEWWTENPPEGWITYDVATCSDAIFAGAVKCLGKIPEVKLYDNLRGSVLIAFSPVMRRLWNAAHDIWLAAPDGPSTEDNFYALVGINYDLQDES